MIVVLRRGTTDEQRDTIVGELEQAGLEVKALRGGGKPLLHVLSGSTRRAKRVLKDDRVEALVPTSGPRIRRVGRRIYPYHFIIWCAAGVLIFGVMVLLAGLFPPGTEAVVDLEHPPETVAWPWYLRGTRAFVVLFSPERRWIGWAVAGVVALAAFLLPVLDRTEGEGLRNRWPVVGAGFAVLAVVFFLTLTGGGS